MKEAIILRPGRHNAQTKPVSRARHALTTSTNPAIAGSFFGPVWP